MAYRVGVDIGGTFTDFIVYDESGNKVIIDKIPTTPQTPEKAVVDVIKRNLTKEDLQKVDFFLHGTTVGLNALLERKGSKVGLLCTKGFRDILEIRRGDRDEMYNLFWQPAPPLVPRFLRIEIEERLHADGTINQKLHSDDIKNACKKFIDEGVSSVAIAFINSYANKIDHVISGPDNGIYSAINKGLKLSTGSVIGLLHAGDLFYDNNVLTLIQKSFKDHESDLIYGHSVVFRKMRDKLVRKNISPPYKENLIKLGWFPSHQSIYFKASVFDKCGFYNEAFKIAGDYEFLLRVLHVFKLKATMVDVVVIKFHLGGASSKNLISLFESNYECYKAWKMNNLSLPFYTLPLKIARKIWQHIKFKF